MGGKQSVQIQTPQFFKQQWEYTNGESVAPDEYGFFRTLRNIKTGEKIDQYQFIWPNEDEYNYYLQSFNWRHRLTNVVNTRYIVNKSQNEICSHSYMGSVYIEHIKVRLSQISDIPYPDNLYVLMESLEGYNKIYSHSKYFEIEQNQICVDEYGNIKIWVNSDLSMNYPNNQSGFIEYKHKGQEDMVQKIVNIVASNTDPQTEPTQTFRDYFEQKKGQKGKKFEEARVLVLNYARIHQTEIPFKFDSIANLQKDNNDTEGIQLSDHSQYRSEKYPLNRFYQANNQRSTSNLPNYPTYSFGGPLGIPQFVQTNQINTFNSQLRPISYPINQPLYHPNLNAINYSPVANIPYYVRVQHPAPTFPQPNNNQFVSRPNNFISRQPSFTASFNPSQVNSQHNNHPLNAFEISKHSANIANDEINNEIDQPKYDQYHEDDNHYQHQQETNIQHHEDHRYSHEGNATASHQWYNSNMPQYNHSVSQIDDMVARSLPIKAGYPSQNTQQLATMGQNQRIHYSHISPKEWNINAHGFGLANHSQMKLKDSAISNNRINSLNGQQKSEYRPIKYYYSLDEELQIDPVIAFDMAKYLS